MRLVEVLLVLSLSYRNQNDFRYSRSIIQENYRAVSQNRRNQLQNSLEPSHKIAEEFTIKFMNEFITTSLNVTESRSSEFQKCHAFIRFVKEPCIIDLVGTPHRVACQALPLKCLRVNLQFLKFHATWLGISMRGKGSVAN